MLSPRGLRGLRWLLQASCPTVKLPARHLLSRRASAIATAIVSLTRCARWRSPATPIAHRCTRTSTAMMALSLRMRGSTPIGIVRTTRATRTLAVRAAPIHRWASAVPGTRVAQRVHAAPLGACATLAITASSASTATASAPTSSAAVSAPAPTASAAVPRDTPDTAALFKWPPRCRLPRLLLSPTCTMQPPATSGTSRLAGCPLPTHAPAAGRRACTE
mmetsp:Transcript_88288/g.265767  ORF Transcript_88288/g.265767 Transcript_88288/m.265767 type:complete len:219 (-) Transcript_88288:310-966(-)